MQFTMCNIVRGSVRVQRYNMWHYYTIFFSNTHITCLTYRVIINMAVNSVLMTYEWLVNDCETRIFCALPWDKWRQRRNCLVFSQCLHITMQEYPVYNLSWIKFCVLSPNEEMIINDIPFLYDKSIISSFRISNCAMNVIICIEHGTSRRTNSVYVNRLY